MSRLFASLALGLSLALSASCSPDTPTHRTVSIAPDGIDRLYERLRATEDPFEAQALEAAIRQLWTIRGPHAANALMARAMDAVHQGQPGIALSILDRVVSLAPDFSEGWTMRASLHFLNDDPGQAVADLAHALALEPRHFSALASLGYILLDLAENAKALTAFEASLAVNPHQPHVVEQVTRLQRQLAGLHI